MTDVRDISVELTGPAKVYGVREPAGKTVTVSATVALHLAAAGVINPELATSIVAAAEPLGSDFDSAVRAAVADREANWSTAMDHFETMAEDSLEAALEAERGQAKARIEHLEADILKLKDDLDASEGDNAKLEDMSAKRVRELEQLVTELQEELQQRPNAPEGVPPNTEAGPKRAAKPKA